MVKSSKPVGEGSREIRYGLRHRVPENLTAALGNTIIVPVLAVAETSSRVFRPEGHSLGAVNSGPLKPVGHRRAFLTWTSWSVPGEMLLGITREKITLTGTFEG